jgi:hypothetical protein
MHVCPLHRHCIVFVIRIEIRYFNKVGGKDQIRFFKLTTKCLQPRLSSDDD